MKFVKFPISRETIGQVKTYILAHKILSSVIIVVLAISLGFGWQFALNANKTISYVVAAVTKGTIMATVTGSGQVSASHQIDIKPKASGDVVLVNVKEGQAVKSGQLLIQIDARDAAQAVSEARISLRNAQISLEKLKKSSPLTLLQTQQAKQQAEDALTKAYDDTLSAVSNAFLQLPSVMSGLDDILHGDDYATRDNMYYYADIIKGYGGGDSVALIYQDSAESTYQTAKTAYDKNFIDYKTTSRYANTDAVGRLLIETYETTKSIAEALKNTSNLLGATKDAITDNSGIQLAQLATHQSSAATYIGQVNSNLSSLLSIKNSIANSKYTLAEKTAALEELEDGGSDLDIESAQLSVTQRQNALYNAQRAWADYSVKAPFDGVVAILDVQKGDSVGSGTAVATVITKQNLVDIPLNEVDIAKVTLGNKATLTFDAIEGLSITGVVAAMDGIGTVSQGVVTYSVTVAFDTQDDRVKPGMSVSATIITDIKQDVLTISSSAVKNQGNVSYVEMLNQQLSSDQVQAGTSVPSTGALRQQTVVVGISDDTATEIISGLNEGDQIIVRTVTSSKSKTTSNSQSTSSLLGGGATRGSGMMMGGVPR